MVLAVGALGLALGALVLGSLTAPPPEAAPEATTTTTADEVVQPIDLENFTIAEIERGARLEWSQGLSISSGFPLALLEHEGWTYIFATDQPSFAAHDEGGLRVWRSTDGVEWESLGQVIGAEHLVSSVHSTPQGLVATERDISGDQLTLLRSNDGVAWTNEDIAISNDDARLSVYAQAVGGSDRILVVSVMSGLDIPRLIEETIGLEVDSGNFGWGPNYQNGEFELVLWGPIGFPLAEIHADDLALTEEERAILEAEYQGGPEFETWVSAESGQWLESDIPGASWINSIMATPSGQILATGWDNQSNNVWTTLDGFTWEEIDLGVPKPDEIQVWNDLLIGPSRSGLASVVTSQDGLEWERIGPESHLPGLIQWNLGVMGSGSGGIAAALHGWKSSTFVPSDEPVTLTDGEATLTIDYNTGSYQVDSGDISRTWSMNSSKMPDGITVDLTAELVTFHATDTNEELASFTFDQLTEAETTFWSRPEFDGRHDGLVFTPNGEDWTIQDPSRWTDGSIQLLEVTGSHVVAAVTSEGDRFSPQTSPGFEIWSAPIP